jgi:hypothetical protein
MTLLVNAWLIVFGVSVVGLVSLRNFDRWQNYYHRNSHKTIASNRR